jgi:hypothetical protein
LVSSVKRAIPSIRAAPFSPGAAGNFGNFAVGSLDKQGLCNAASRQCCDSTGLTNLFIINIMRLLLRRSTNVRRLRSRRIAHHHGLPGTLPFFNPCCAAPITVRLMRFLHLAAQ